MPIKERIKPEFLQLFFQFKLTPFSLLYITSLILFTRHFNNLRRGQNLILRNRVVSPSWTGGTEVSRKARSLVALTQLAHFIPPTQLLEN
ncbi:hypothetical protein E2C01_098739 [Portunus trituberculatus]|uniref:Uncharacterized protein n=1 Tax=Portunus trituberculatus TaxID=210409 RepID=A0A5B7KCV3_PORTR|nr:hypothetical protein [Portunus trituberculatus]